LLRLTVNVSPGQCDDDDDYKLNAFLDDAELQEENEKEKNVYKKLKDELDAYCRQSIVFGFNSAKYAFNGKCFARTVHIELFGEMCLDEVHVVFRRVEWFDGVDKLNIRHYHPTKTSTAP
jgi:hypothetical protein